MRKLKKGDTIQAPVNAEHGYFKKGDKFSVVSVQIHEDKTQSFRANGMLVYGSQKPIEDYLIGTLDGCLHLHSNGKFNWIIKRNKK